MVAIALRLRDVGKIIYVADVTTKSSSKLSTGQVAAIIVCLGFAFIGGFVAYVYIMGHGSCCCCMLLFERSQGHIDYDEDDDTGFKSRVAGLWTNVVDKMRALGDILRDKIRRRQALHGSDAELDSETKLDDPDLY